VLDGPGAEDLEDRVAGSRHAGSKRVPCWLRV
jgi:hypothetical protein